MKISVFKGIVLLAFLMLAPAASTAAAQGGGVHWAYTGAAGPEHWGGLLSGFSDCSAGMIQSPVDIGQTVEISTGGLEFHYKNSPLKVVNNGHTIQANQTPGSFVVIGGAAYELLQFHFHSPSENTVRGAAYPMEVHLVHRSAQGELAVVGVLLAEGAASPLVQAVWDGIPHETGHENVTGRTIQAESLLPANRSFYHFEGSLTTPPCSEGVKWYVMKTPVTVSSGQVARFLSIIGPNARPTRPLNGRVVFEVNVATVQPRAVDTGGRQHKGGGGKRRT